VLSNTSQTGEVGRLFLISGLVFLFLHSFLKAKLFFYEITRNYKRRTIDGKIVVLLLFFVDLQSSTSSTTLPPGGIGWDWGAIFNSTDFHAGSGKGSNSGLATWSWGFLFGTTSGSDFDVEGGDAEFFASGGDVLSGLHSSVWRVLISISFDFHTTGNSGDSFFSGQIGDMNEGIVVTGVKMANTENVFTVGNSWAQFDDLFFFDDLLFWSHDLGLFLLYL
jgi:hypothetical protein